MSYNAYILKKLEADRYLASVLDKSVSKVGKESLKQANSIYDGTERISWYLSCFTEDYFDVCVKIAKEDYRFIKAIRKLVGPTKMAFTLSQRVFLGTLTSNYNYNNIIIIDDGSYYPDIINAMIEKYIDNLFLDISEARISNILRILNKYSAKLTASGLTKRAVAYPIVTAICISAGLKAALESTLTTSIRWGVGGIGLYSYVRIAADAADRLKTRSPKFYNILYNMGLEMLYFLIEPITIKTTEKFRKSLSDEQIAAAILRLIE